RVEAVCVRELTPAQQGDAERLEIARSDDVRAREHALLVVGVVRPLDEDRPRKALLEGAAARDDGLLHARQTPDALDELRVELPRIRLRLRLVESFQADVQG